MTLIGTLDPPVFSQMLGSQLRSIMPIYAVLECACLVGPESAQSNPMVWLVRTIWFTHKAPDIGLGLSHTHMYTCREVGRRTETERKSIALTDSCAGTLLICSHCVTVLE